MAFGIFTSQTVTIQAIREILDTTVMDFQLEEARLRQALERISSQKILLTRPDKPTPFAFPIMVDHMREKLTSEKLEDRIKRMAIQFSED